MIYILAACMVMLVIAAFLVTARAVKGPTSLDRMVSVDMVSSILIGSVALLAALTRRSDLLALFIVLALVGFVGSTALARFITPLDPSARRILSKDEESELDAQISRRPDDAAPVHDVDALESDDADVDVYDPDEVDFSGTDVDPDDVSEAGPQHDGATAVERREP